MRDTGTDVNRLAEVKHWLHRIYVATDDATLRQEDCRKAIQVAAMLEEIERAARLISNRSELVLVDAAAGKSYLGLLAAKLILEPLNRPARVIAIETDPQRVERSREGLKRLGTRVAVDLVGADVADPRAWPGQPSIVAALHACGPASDSIIDRAVEAGTRVLLLVPCCTSRQVPSFARADAAARRLRMPRQAPVRRRFLQAWVDAERTWRLEAAGYATEVVELVGPTVTPHNLLWRCRRTSRPSLSESRTPRAVP
jgi:hypothetical protein